MFSSNEYAEIAARVFLEVKFASFFGGEFKVFLAITLLC